MHQHLTSCWCFPAAHAGPVGTYNPDPLSPAARMGGQDYGQKGSDPAYLNAFAHKDEHPADLVAATPNYKPCVPCGNGYNTRHTQSTSSKDCLADCPCGECPTTAWTNPHCWDRCMIWFFGMRPLVQLGLLYYQPCYCLAGSQRHIYWLHCCDVWQLALLPSMGLKYAIRSIWAVTNTAVVTSH